MRKFLALKSSVSRIGVQISMFPCRVIESKNKDCTVGDYVVGSYGWATHTIVVPEESGPPKYYKLDSSMPADMRSLALGALGMPG